jgi:hypothetical protein
LPIQYLFVKQTSVSFEYFLGVAELGLILVLFGNGLVECRLIRSWVNLQQDIAAADILALVKIHLHDFAVNLRSDCHGV